MMDSITHIAKLNDSLVSILKGNQTILTRYELLVDSQSANINILSIWIGVVSIILPIIFVVIGFYIDKKYKKEIADLKGNVFSILENHKNELILQAFKKLKTNNSIDIHNASQFLMNQFDYKFSEQEIIEIINVHDNSNEIAVKGNLVSIIASNPTLASDRFFKKLIKEGKAYLNIYNIVKYLNNSSSDFTQDFIIHFKDKDDRMSLLFNLLNFSQNVNSILFLKYLNNKELITTVFEGLRVSEVESYLSSIKSFFTNPDDFETTFLYKEYETIKKVQLLDDTTESKVVQNIIDKDANAIKAKKFKFVKGKLIDENGIEYKKEKASRSILTGMLIPIIDAFEIDGKYYSIDDIKKYLS